MDGLATALSTAAAAYKLWTTRDASARESTTPGWMFLLATTTDGEAGIDEPPKSLQEFLQRKSTGFAFDHITDALDAKGFRCKPVASTIMAAHQGFFVSKQVGVPENV